MDADPQHQQYRRILLKISGEALGDGRNGIDPPTIAALITEIVSVQQKGIQVAIVCGGGNFFRGIKADRAIDRTAADAMGMLATMINGLALKEFFKDSGIPAAVMAAYPIEGVIEPFCAEKARELLQANTILILAGGTGLPYFSTDTAAALRALQINADVLIKATKVDGVFDKDPKKYPDARRYDRLSYDRVLNDRLEVMDAASIALCRDHRLPVLVFNLVQPGNLMKLFSGELIGTFISDRG
jgi:uridylate kinase